MNIVKCQRPATLLAWPTYSAFNSLSDEIDRLLESPFASLGRNAWSPTIDVLEDKDNYIVLAELPGLKREDIEVSVEDGVLRITGERKVENRSEGTSVHRVERFSGRFERSVALPVSVSTDKVKAAYNDGVLTVTLPKSEQAKPKRINVTLN
jgi:HSP20 family protein